MARKPNVLLLPGSLCDEWIWHPQIAALSDSYDVDVPHFLEFDTIEAMAMAVLASAPERFSLAGHAMGGRVALEVLRAAPERVERLALLDSSVHPIRGGEGERRKPLIDLAQRDGMEALARAWLPRIVRPACLEDLALMDGLTKMMCRLTPETYIREASALLNRPDARTVLPMIKCPTLILTGRDDPLSPPGPNEELAAQIPNARLVILDNCSHFPTLEAPQATTAALRQWLSADSIQ